MRVKNPSPLKTWLIAIRPFALPASTMPVLYGSVMAVVIGGASFKVLLFLLALFTMVILTSGAHILSDVNDFRRGLDSISSPGSGAIVQGYLTLQEALTGALVLFGLGGVLTTLIVYLVGLPLLLISGIGIVIGVFYTVRPIALKYHALGDFAVFLNYGVLGTLGAWTVQTGSMGLIPVLWSIPISLLVAAILHANNWRDIETDAEKNIKTIALLIGARRSRIYYHVLIFGAFGIVLFFIIMPRSFEIFGTPMPYTTFITLALIPQTLRLSKKAASGREEDLNGLDVATAKLNLLFGLLCTGALLLANLIENPLF